MDFVSIDFETANEKRNSACSLGIAVVKDNKIVEVKYWLIKPYEMRFAPMNIWIHGIVEEDVENERNMNELWHDIKPYLENNFVIAHNASFDMSVLRNTLDNYGISYPGFNYSCTMVMSKNYYTDLENYKLNTIARHLDIKFKHHHAGEDAAAAANILINICEELNVDTVDELSSKLNLRIGRMYEGGYSSAGSLISSRRKRITNRSTGEITINQKREDINKEHPFFNKTIVFTGPLDSLSRAEAMKNVINVGGIVGSSVTRKTNYLVAGVCNIEKLSFDKKSNKLRKAELFIEKGQDIHIISESKFFDMI
ncbi:exonuclease domain-containing protein [Tepidibacter aestuarii]|uniref:exonuclease domain-containing protein n=1 Tax=Tepidibacter aestuarii TaxID=2925782 RepID=UPI0020BF731D|nr:exonuclease domain-containing protein [Tepidibacter aestuarii]CAH2213040.1 DNA polymerase III subunit epsilon [Tepidibacter aestuarii]